MFLRCSIGDTEIPFTIQSSGKPMNYAIALTELGSDIVHQYVGQEPSGRMFNELVLDYNSKFFVLLSYNINSVKENYLNNSFTLVLVILAVFLFMGKKICVVCLLILCSIVSVACA